MTTMTTTLPVLHRKRKLSISGPATKQTLIKKFKEEIEAEKRKKVRLEWYLKQLLLEKELLVKENEIEFANAMQSLGDTDALVGRPPLGASAMTTTPAAPVPTSEDAPSTSSVSVPTIVLPTADFLPSSSLLFGDNSGLPGSSSSSSLSAKFDNPFFAVPPPAPLTPSPSSAPAVPPVTSAASKAEQEDPCTVFFDDLSLFAAKYYHDDAKPSTSAEEPSAFFSAEWEQTHCWWADEELSQILAVPPSLMV